MEIANPIRDVPVAPASLRTTPRSDSESGAWAGEEFSFHDILDAINPLQHLPVISTIYRALTGDTIGNVARIVGDTLFGGPIGLVSSLVAVAIKDETGADPGQHILAMLDLADTPVPTTNLAKGGTTAPADDIGADPAIAAEIARISPAAGTSGPSVATPGAMAAGKANPIGAAVTPAGTLAPNEVTAAKAGTVTISPGTDASASATSASATSASVVAGPGIAAPMAAAVPGRAAGIPLPGRSGVSLNRSTPASASPQQEFLAQNAAFQQRGLNGSTGPRPLQNQPVPLQTNSFRPPASQLRQAQVAAQAAAIGLTDSAAGFQSPGLQSPGLQSPGLPVPGLPPAALPAGTPANPYAIQGFVAPQSAPAEVSRKMLDALDKYSRTQQRGAGSANAAVDVLQ